MCCGKIHLDLAIVKILQLNSSKVLNIQEKLPFHKIPLIQKLEVASSYTLRIAKHDLWIRNFDILSNDAMTSTLKNTYIRISRQKRCNDVVQVLEFVISIGRRNFSEPYFIFSNIIFFVSPVLGLVKKSKSWWLLIKGCIKANKLMPK